MRCSVIRYSVAAIPVVEVCACHALMWYLFTPCVLTLQLLELKKANKHVLEAEKGKFCAETEKRVLEERVQEVGKKLSAADDKLREAELQKQLTEKEAQSYKEEVTQLSAGLAEMCLQKEAVKDRVQEVEGERAALETRVASLQAEVESGVKEKEEEVRALEQKLGDARKQQQTVEEELKVVWKEMGEKQERWSWVGCGRVYIVNVIL